MTGCLEITKNKKSIFETCNLLFPEKSPALTHFMEPVVRRTHYQSGQPGPLMINHELRIFLNRGQFYSKINISLADHHLRAQIQEFKLEFLKWRCNNTTSSLSFLEPHFTPCVKDCKGAKRSTQWTAKLKGSLRSLESLTPVAWPSRKLVSDQAHEVGERPTFIKKAHLTAL